jgi:dTDP-4-dehydrorhamnose reductase
MTSFLIVGAGGMLGQDLRAALAGRDVIALSRAELDISDRAALEAAVAGHDVVLNAAGYTAVDLAESQEDAAFEVNAVGAENLARATHESGARLVHFSTDYVFDGVATTPYSEDHNRDPRGAYGRTKAEGERRVLSESDDAIIVRTAWTYGEHGPNFAATMLRLGAERDHVDVVNDQRGQPTWTLDLANRVIEMLDADVPGGIYHGTNSGSATWFDFAQEVFRLGGFDPERVKPTTSEAFVRPAPRPAYSVLGHDRWTDVGFAPLRPWREALAAAFETGALTAS